MPVLGFVYLASGARAVHNYYLPPLLHHPLGYHPNRRPPFFQFAGHAHFNSCSQKIGCLVDTRPHTFPSIPRPDPSVPCKSSVAVDLRAIEGTFHRARKLAGGGDWITLSLGQSSPLFLLYLSMTTSISIASPLCQPWLLT